MKRLMITSQASLVRGAVIALLAAGCFAFFQYVYPYHFFYKEQNQIFLMSWTYIGTYFSKPAWAACLAGDFLTQFYYYLYAGAVILTLSLLTMGDIIRRALLRAGMADGASFVIAVAAMILEAICHFRADFRLASTMAVIGGAATFFIAASLLRIDRMRRFRFLNDLIVVSSAAVTYWMFGYGWIVFILLSVVSAVSYMNVRTVITRIAYLPIFMLCIGFTQRQYQLRPKDNITYPGIGKLTRPEMDLEQYFKIDNEYYFGHYREVVNMCSRMDSLSGPAGFFYGLSLAHLGILADMMTLDEPADLGTFCHVSAATPILTVKMMNELYYVLGDMTLTERAAMMANVFSPDGRNVRMMKRLAEANLVGNDIPAAMKYLRLLGNTIVYKKWARDHTPGMQTAEVRAEIARKRQFVNRRDTLRLTDNCREVLVGLLRSNPRNTVALDYLLCSDLQAREITVFMDDYNKYNALQKRTYQPALYQQAVAFFNQNNPNK